MSKLVMVEGPGRGVSFDVDGGVTLGRSRTCTIRLEGHAMSRVHARLDRRPDGLALLDVDSRNGIFVNGRKVKEHLLKGGDEIEIGEFVFVFDPKGDPHDQKSRTVAVVREQLADPFAAEEIPEADLRAAHERLRLVLETTSLLHSMQDEHAAMKTLLERILANVPALRGFVMLLDAKGKAVPAAKDAPEGEDEFCVSSVIYHRLMRERRALIATDVEKQGSRAGKSVSILCAPIVAGERFLGLVYLDGPSETTSFRHADARFVAALAVSAAGLLVHLRKEPDALDRVWKREAGLPALLADLEKRCLEEALRRCSGDSAKAAEMVGMSRPAFDSAVKEWKIEPQGPVDWKSVEV
jgi:transcriptional regulator with GAF, ATPase, and Fis domain